MLLLYHQRKLKGRELYNCRYIEEMVQLANHNSQNAFTNITTRSHANA